MLPVHNHSEYSALDGYSKISEIADRIEELGLPGCFLTDHGTVAGLSEFASVMKKRDLFVGYGMEAYQARNKRSDRENPEGKKFRKGEDAYHLVLLAASKEGYLNLMRISDASHRTGFYYDPRVDFQLLKQYREGIIATSACLSSLINKQIEEGGKLTTLDEMIKIFEDDFLIEIHTYDSDEQRARNKELVSIAQEKGLRLVYANDAHYAQLDQWLTHEKLLCAQYGEQWGGPKKYGHYTDEDGRSLHNPPSLYIMAESEVRAALDHLPQAAVDEAISTSDWLMERCRFELDETVLHLPKFKSADSELPSADLLQDLVAAGIDRLYGGTDLEEEAWDRAEYELDAIIGAGLHDYFLIVWDYINYALSHGKFVGPGRGSVGGSIIAYALGITSICPLKYGLQFERFWNPGREEGLPDIDIDFATEDRQFMINYVRQKYGENQVLLIGNHAYMHPMSAIRKAAAVIYEDPPYGDLKSITQLMKSTSDAGQVKNWQDMWEALEEEDEEHPLEEYRKEYPEMFELAEAIEGRIANYGVHASAVVISDVPLADHLPARMATDEKKRKELVTQAEMHQVEKAGFPKFDFLGLRNLDTIMRAAILSGEFGEDSVETRKKIVQHFRHEIDWEALPEEFWTPLDQGYTLGVFQIEESTPPKRMAKHMQPRSIDDLAVIVALNRPGPLRGGVVDRYLDRREGKEEVSYPHEILEDILEPTYGDFLFQEQVIGYFSKIGYSPSDADHIRKILGKKLVEEMKAEFPIYVEAATQFMSQQAAQSIWELIENFSKYSFNKAHSVGYGMISAWTNYAKWRWPTAFIMASIETNEERIGAWINEARRIRVEVLPPDVNRSERLVQMVDGAIIYGLQNIKGIGAMHADWIVQHRPWDSPEDLISRCEEATPIVVNSGHVKKFIDAGAVDSFGYRAKKCENCDGTGRYKPDPEVRKRADCPECGAWGWVEDEIPAPEIRADLEEALLGLPLTDVHGPILEKHAKAIAKLDPIAAATITEKTIVKVPGIITEIKPTTVKKNGAEMAHIRIAWQGEELRFAAFPEVWKDYGFVLKKGSVGRFKLETGPRGPNLKEMYRYTL